MARHIFLTGKKQIGKSTLLQKILKNYQGTADGFLTVRTKEYLGDQYSVHMYHLTESRDPNEQNLLFVCGKANEHTADSERKSYIFLMDRFLFLASYRNLQKPAGLK